MVLRSEMTKATTSLTFLTAMLALSGCYTPLRAISRTDAASPDTSRVDAPSTGGAIDAATSTGGGASAGGAAGSSVDANGLGGVGGLLLGGQGGGVGAGGAGGSLDGSALGGAGGSGADAPISTGGTTSSGGVPATGGATSSGGVPATGGSTSTQQTSLTCTGTTKLCNGACIPTTDCCGGCSGNTPVCSNGTCVGRSIGDACTTGPECAKGVCADGVCCNVACDGQCESCATTASRGTCVPVTKPRTPCNGGTSVCAGVCDGTATNRKACVYPDDKTSCGSPSCSGSSIVQGGQCSNGTCNPGQAQDCNGGFICSGNACKTSCMLDIDCRSDYFCSGGTCHSDAIAVSSSGDHVCVISADHKIHCWGTNDQGQLGDGTVSAAWTTTPSTVSGINNAVSVGSGASFSCALLDDATVRCWGGNTMAQLGIGEVSSAYKGSPATSLGLSSVIALGVGYGTVCAVEQGGNVKCWGYNSQQILGSSNFMDPTPVQIPGITGAKAIAVGGTQVCVLVTDGTPKCWGENIKLQAGAPASMSTVDTPRTADGTGSGFTSVTAGNSHTCVLKNGSATCWGDNTMGQLGTSTVLSPQTAQVLNQISGMAAISAGVDSTCALLTNGSVWCWGNVMSASYDSATVYPAQVNLAGAKGVSGASHSCAILANGSVSCWGWCNDTYPPVHYSPSSPVAAAGW